MKILLSNSQIKKLIFEAINKRYLDKILDKALENGFESLTDYERNALDTMSKPYNDYVDDPDETKDTRKSVTAHNPLDDEDDDLIDNPNDEDLVDNPDNDFGKAYEMFMKYLPDRKKISVGGDMWILEIVDEEGYNVIRLMNKNRIIYIKPFWKNENIGFYNEYDKLLLNITPQNIPDDDHDMEAMTNIFINEILPAVLSNLK